MNIDVSSTPIDGLLVLRPRVFADDRGWFTESFNARTFALALQQAGLGEAPGFVQDNHSASRRGVLRGLHYQMPPHAQGKLVRVIRGAVWDVAVDLRRGSATFGRWHGLELSADNRLQFWIPAGFAHGFVTLSDTAEFVYKTTDFYDKASERCIVWNDPDLAIDWPLPGGTAPLLADKDAAGAAFRAADCFA